MIVARGEFSSSLPSKYFGGEEFWRRGILEERNFQGNEFFIYWGILEKRNFGGEEF